MTSSAIAQTLESGIHYTVDEKAHSVLLTEKGYEDSEKVIGKSLFDPQDPWAALITNALKAKEIFTKDKDYIVKDNQIQIVDQFSGRILTGRRYTDGLHQNIEAKEGIPVSTQSKVTAKVTYQSLYRLFPKFAGMTGTALTDASEFQGVYGLNVVPIPTALPVARRDNPAAVFRSSDGKRR